MSSSFVHITRVHCIVFRNRISSAGLNNLSNVVYQLEVPFPVKFHDIKSNFPESAYLFLRIALHLHPFVVILALV